MEQLQRYLREQLNMDRCGGRMVSRDEGTLILYDVPTWSDRHASALLARFPEVELSVTSNAHSLSGFVVVVHMRPGGRMQVCAALFVLATLGMTYTLVSLRRALV